MLKSHRKSIFDILGRGPIHPFPARMAPGIALEALGESAAPIRVLDPMVGSGTVLAVARAKGHRAFGVDLDPLAVLLARVWTRTVNAKQARETAIKALARAKTISRRLSVRHAYPLGADDETRQFVRFWFDGYARRQLASLSIAIGEVQDCATREVLWCGFSRLIITKSAGASLAMDLSHSRPHKSFSRAPVKPFRRFVSAVDTVVLNCPQARSVSVGPAATVKYGDARRLDLPSESIDLVLTSPPYLNGIDYMRCSKFTLVWMGHHIRELKEIRRASVGTEASSVQAKNAKWIEHLVKQLRLRPIPSQRDESLLRQYACDMNGALTEAARVLKYGGRAVYVVGDSMSKGTFMPNSRIVTAVAKRHGLTLLSRQSRTLPSNRRYLPPPKRLRSKETLDGRLRKEVVLVFSKP